MSLLSRLQSLATAIGGDVKALNIALAGKSDSGHTHSYSSITSKPATFPPSAHDHDRLTVTTDDRGLVTTPDDYNDAFITRFRYSSTLGVPTASMYVQVLGYRAWGTSSGGEAHELAFANDGVWHRSGASTAWGAWRKVMHEDFDNVFTNDARLTNARTPSNDSNLVHRSGNETISGIKTFNDEVILGRSGQSLRISNTNPEIQFEDPGEAGAGRNYWIHHNSGIFYILQDRTGDGAWNSPHPFQINPDGRVYIGNGFSGLVKFDRTLIGNVTETFSYLGNGLSGAVNLNLNVANVFELGQSGNITLSMTNLPSDGSTTTTVMLWGNGNGYTVTPPSGSKIVGGSIPTSKTGQFIILTMQNNGHTSWTIVSAVQTG